MPDSGDFKLLRIFFKPGANNLEAILEAERFGVLQQAVNQRFIITVRGYEVRMVSDVVYLSVQVFGEVAAGLPQINGKLNAG